MNIFRLTGDLSHLLAIIILLRKIWKTRSCAGAKCILENENEIYEKPPLEPDIHEYRVRPCKTVTTPHPKSMIHQQTLKTPVIEFDSFETAHSEKCDELLLINPIHLQNMQFEREQLLCHHLNDGAPTRCQGISGKSQILFAVVYTTRYLDLLTTYVSMYNTLMKLVFIAASYATCYFIYIKFKATYDHNHDTFRIEFLLVPAVILSLLINHDFTILEVLWTFSIYLESVAILPQLFMVSKTGEAESITSHYLFALGSYRGLYILNWIYRYVTEEHYDLIAIVAGIVQTVLYCDFFYLYITKVLRGKKLQLPA